MLPKSRMFLQMNSTKSQSTDILYLMQTIPEKQSSHTHFITASAIFLPKLQVQKRKTSHSYRCKILSISKLNPAMYWKTNTGRSLNLSWELKDVYILKNLLLFNFQEWKGTLPPSFKKGDL